MGRWSRKRSEGAGLTSGRARPEEGARRTRGQEARRPAVLVERTSRGVFWRSGRRDAGWMKMAVGREGGLRVARGGQRGGRV